MQQAPPNTEFYKLNSHTALWRELAYLGSENGNCPEFLRILKDFVQAHDPEGFKCPNDETALVNISPLVFGVEYKCPVCGWELVEVK